MANWFCSVSNNAVCSERYAVNLNELTLRGLLFSSPRYFCNVKKLGLKRVKQKYFSQTLNRAHISLSLSNNVAQQLKHQ